MGSQDSCHTQLGWLLGTLKASTEQILFPQVLLGVWSQEGAGMANWKHWRCQQVLFPLGFSGIWYFLTIGWELNLDLILGMGSQDSCHIQLGWLLGTLKVSTEQILFPQVLLGVWSQEGAGMANWKHWRCQEILFPPGFSGTWHFPTVGLELNSGNGHRTVAIYSWDDYWDRFCWGCGHRKELGWLIGNIEGVNRYCFHLGSVAYGTSSPLG